ncbi:hypothetical protein E8E13_003370 [Curvularia kusanoi]|uniref:Uncharacterized protein n=1 Tax=Curvularia kusanoi TaxID=90978 RepID=A0A9P4WA68_CURKU|nr:hypothetical protein E8E13_003370 [Curvularia kusanoi]
MSLKHLLNYDDVEDHARNLPSPWCDLTESHEYTHEEWTSLPSEIFGSNAMDEISWDSELSTLESTWGNVTLSSGGITLDEQQPAHRLVVNESVSQHTTNVCYGMIYRTAVKLCGTMVDLDRKLRSSPGSPIQGHVMLTLRQVENRFLVTFPDGDVYGEVNAQLHEALSRVSQQAYHLDFEVFAPVNATREKISTSTKDKTAIVRVQINVYGDLISAGHIGRELSQDRIYLQRPDYLRSDAQYDNPHMLKLTGFSSGNTATAAAEPGNEVEKNAPTDFDHTLTTIYSSLTRSQKLNRLKGDDRLMTQLME